MKRGIGIVEVDLDEQEPFVVAEADVVARLIFLDQLAFQQERLRFAAHGVGVEIVDGLDQGVEFQVPTHAARGMEISADAFAQIARLADVNDRAEAVLHQVNARLVRHFGKFLPNLFGGGHAGSQELEAPAGS